MKAIIAAALVAISTSAFALDPTSTAAMIMTSDNNGGDTVLQQNNQNDPSIHGRRTQTAYELGEVGQAGDLNTPAAEAVTTIEVYPAIDEYK